jgi:non-specific serine/threonine protein kinase
MLLDESLALHRGANISAGMATAHLALGSVALEMGDLDNAAAHYLDAMKLFAKAGDWSTVAVSVEGLSWIVVRHNPSLETQLLAAAATSRERFGRAHDTFDFAEYRKARSTARKELGEQAFADAWAAGRAMSLQEAIALAMQAEAGPPPASTASPTDRFGITPREYDVLCLLAEGRTDQEIADALYLSRRTVNTHVSRLLAKLGVPNRRQAIAMARERELLIGCHPGRYSDTSGP